MPYTQIGTLPVHDSFGGSGFLTDRAADSGHTWNELDGTGGGTSQFMQVGGGEAYNRLGFGTTVGIPSVLAAETDPISITIQMRALAAASAGNSTGFHVYFRTKSDGSRVFGNPGVVSDPNDFYGLYLSTSWDLVTQNLELTKFIDYNNTDVETSLGTYTPALVAGNFTLNIQCDGSGIVVSIDGTPVITTADAAITDGGSVVVASVCGGAGVTDKESLHMVDFLVGVATARFWTNFVGTTETDA